MTLHLGAAWYPEHWPAERWAEDIRLMQQANFSVARLGEFAWSSLEPAAGQFDFDWLERAIDLLAAAGIAAVLGTPTAAPPAWLSQAEPGILAQDPDGHPASHGMRCHYCVNSPEYHAAVTRLVSALAQRFGGHANVIGWQVDNEFNRVCYCPRCRQAFQDFLQTRYGDLETLNRRWTTAYWSQTYDDWSQIPLPAEPGHNPGLVLEFHRFVSASYRRFLELQTELLRPCLRPGVWITHNFMGWFGGYDHYELCEPLDLASWDQYVGRGRHDYLKSAAHHALVRGFKRRNFWLMETQPGSVNWAGVNNSLDRGAARALAWQAVAHGAEAVLYWQWRPALGGQEQLHGSLLDASGQPRPFFAEARQLGQEFKDFGGLLEGSELRPRVAILHDYPSRWVTENQPHHADFDYLAHLQHYTRTLARRNLPFDVLPPGAELSGYKLVIAPALQIVSPDCLAALRRFVAHGGHLLLTLRSGVRDEYNALLPQPLPGPLAELAGIQVEETYVLDSPIALNGNWFNGLARLWAERVQLGAQATVVARFGKSNGWLDQQPAISVSPYQTGLVYYAGAWLDDQSQQLFMDHLFQTAGLRPLKTPDGVEVVVRRLPSGEDLHLVINHSAQEAALYLPWPVRNHLTGSTPGQEVRLLPYGVALLEKQPVA